MTASALGLAAIIFNDYQHPDPDYQPRNWIDAGLWNLDNPLGRENGISPRFSEPDTLAGYAEGPAYFEYGFENAFPFIRAFWNFLPDSAYAMTFGGVTREIRNPWYDPSYANLYEWMILIRMPDGSSPAIHDSPIGFGTSITSLSGNNRFNIPNPPFPPTDVMWRTQYIATNVTEGSFSDTLFRALPEAGSLVFRSSHEPDAVFMHFIGKHGIPLSGAKAHHQGDASSFSLMANGELLAVDPGYPGYQESSAVNKASNHSLILVNGSGPMPPIGEFVNIETNTCWIERYFDTPELDYGEVRTAYFGVDITRKNLFVRDRYFILADFLSSPNTNTYTFQLQGNGLIGGTPGTPEGAFMPDFTNHQGIYSRDSTQLLVHTIAAGGATNYSDALDSLATGTSQYRHYSKMLVRKDSIQNTGFLSVLFPYTDTQPDVTTLAISPAVNAIRVTDGYFDDLTFTQKDSGMIFIPTSVSSLTENVSGNGTINLAGFNYSNPRNFFLENGDSLMIGLQLYIKADHRMDVAYEQTNALLHQGYVSDAGWVGFQTTNLNHFIPTSGNILDFGYDFYNGLLLVLFGGPSYFT
ncbi:MAG: heparinase II/III family protein, partial [Deltaproteobacteria bacterium]|nr:heparinase II/III family protein [Deltaproteobacteria bacterium]